MEPGSKINLDRLRTSYDISLSPLREALSRLVADGLVELEDLRGYRVAPVSTSNLAEVTRLRVEFESLALQHSIEQGDLEWESDVMRSLYRLNRIERDPARPESLEAWEEAHNDFHRQLIQGCGMPLLLRFCSVLHNLNDRYRRLFLATNPGDRDVRSEHIAIAEAAVARRSSEARDGFAPSHRPDRHQPQEGLGYGPQRGFADRQRLTPHPESKRATNSRSGRMPS